MKLWLSPYQLRTTMGEIRKGYLVKTQAQDQQAGYSDLFPWPAFGDPDFNQIPNMIRKGESSPLIKKSLYFSRRDALERTGKISPLQGKTVKNHYLVRSNVNQWIEEVEKALEKGFKTVKIKVGNDLKNESKALKGLVRLREEKEWLRLDFNGRGSFDYFKEIASIRDSVQFVEDPFSEPSAWGSLDWTWAYDQPSFKSEQVHYSFRVIKPAKQDWEADEEHPLIFTSYLDHPVGIAHAMVEALESGQQLYDYGLMSQNYYEETPFHEYLKCKGPHLAIAGEYGIGFDDLFEELDWIEM